MNAVVLRQAGLVDHPALAALYRRASLANDGDREVLLAHPEALKLSTQDIEAGHVIVAETDGEIAGFSTVIPLDGGAAEMSALFVDPKLWKQGLGRGLVERAADRARGNGADALLVDGNPHAEEFYLACGFVTTGVAETEFGTGLRMQLDLARGTA